VSSETLILIGRSESIGGNIICIESEAGRELAGVGGFDIGACPDHPGAAPPRLRVGRAHVVEARGRGLWLNGPAWAGIPAICAGDYLYRVIPREPARPDVEHYVRCSVAVGDLRVEPGLELRAGDDFAELGERLACLAHAIGIMVGTTADRMAACEAFGPTFEQRWPGRAWFVEIHDAKLERWTQSFQPYGVPRSR